MNKRIGYSEVIFIHEPGRGGLKVLRYFQKVVWRRRLEEVLHVLHGSHLLCFHGSFFRKLYWEWMIAKELFIKAFICLKHVHKNWKEHYIYELHVFGEHRK